MRQQIIPVALIAMLMASTAAAAQNYVAANRYNNPDVVVNFDILGSGMTAPMPHFPQPAYQPPMPPAQPVRLTPPAPRMMPAPVPMAQPMAMPAPVPRAPVDMRNVHLSPPRAPMMDAPPAAPSEPARMVPPMPVLDQPLADAPSAVPAEKSSASRQLLAQARAEAAEDEPVSAPVKKSAARSPILFDDVMPPPPQDELAPSAPKAVGSQKASSVLPMQLGLPQDEPLPPVAAKPSAPKDAVPVADNFEAYRLFFTDKASALSPEEDKVLRGLIAKLKRDEKIRVQILAFAASTPDTASAARRLSLTRALSVRSAMISDGINADRMEVRAMGGGDKTQPPDRVDLVFQQ